MVQEMTSVYHVGHYGFFPKFLLHKLKKHHDEKSFFLIDTTYMSNEVLDFLYNLNFEELNIDVFYYSDTIFWKQASVDCIKYEITCFFDYVFNEMGIEQHTISHYYSGCDGRNAFAAYLAMKSINYTAFDMSSSLTRYFLYKTESNSESKKSYVQIMNEYRCLTDDSVNSTSIIWDKKHYKKLDNKQSISIDYQKILKTLKKEDKTTLTNIFNFNYSREESYSLLFLRSLAYIIYSKCKSDSYGLKEQYYFYYLIFVRNT